MEITLDKKSSNEAVIKVTLNEEDYQSKVENKLKEYGKKANLKGFRPGKTPLGLIRKMYGKSILIEEVNQTLSHSLYEYIQKSDLQILGEPIPDHDKAAGIDWDNQKDFEFTYDIGFIETFDYKIDDKIKVTRYDVEVDKKVIDESIDNIRNQHGKVEHPEESLESDSIEGQLVNEEYSIDQVVFFKVEDATAKQRKVLVGTKAQDIIEIDLKKVFADKAADILGKLPEEMEKLDGKFNLTISKIHRTTPGELNQELFDKVFGKDAVKSEEEFLNKVEESLGQSYQNDTELILNRDIQDQLLDKIKFDIPADFLRRWLLVSNEGKLTEEQVDNEFDQYVKELRWSLIKSRIAKDESLEVNHEDVVDTAKNQFREQFSRMGLSDQIDEALDGMVENYLKENEGQNYTRIHNEASHKKIMDFVREKITIKSKKVDLDGFKKAIEK